MRYRYPKGIRFRCLRCAQCCGDTNLHIRHILMLKSEAQRIAKATSKPVEEFAAKTKEHEPYAYEMKKTLSDAKCIFLRGNSCAIYECRPVICRFYPFEFRPADNGIDEFQHTEECLGIGKGEHVLRKAHFEGLLGKLAKASATRSKSESDVAFE